MRLSATWSGDHGTQMEQRKADINQGFNAEDLESPYLDKLSHKTKSKRIYGFIKLAYFLGWLRGIAYVDGGLTPVTLDK